MIKANKCLFYTEEGFSQGEVDHRFSALVLPNFTCGLPVYGAVESDLTVICDRVTRPRILLILVISRNILLFYYFARNIFALRNFPVRFSKLVYRLGMIVHVPTNPHIIA